MVRALFVGIDTYQYPGDEFDNLSGPVGDVAMIKAALVKAKKLDLDPVGLEPNAAGCRGQNPTSITLVESYASYADVTAALATQIAASQPGDILLFFFAGHGSTYMDASHEQSTGSNDTILPYDAHKLGEMTEILDRELRRTIDGAVARGVSVVTIFDSCHSGTGTREFAGARSREAKPGPYVPLSPARLAALATPRPDVTAPPELRPYRIHLAAAADTELANEYQYQDGWHGAFSRALAQAILARPDASYGDLIAAVRATLDPPAIAIQHPQAEGALAATFLGPDPGPMRLYAATRDKKDIIPAGGMLSGVSEGSTFTLHRDITAAAANQTLATATVTAVSVDRRCCR